MTAEEHFGYIQKLWLGRKKWSWSWESISTSFVRLWTEQCMLPPSKIQAQTRHRIRQAQSSPFAKIGRSGTGRRAKSPLNSDRRRFIQLMQPFEEPVVEPQYRIANFNRSLRFLNDLARLDRHRRLHTFCTCLKRSEPQLRYPTGVSLKEIRVAEPGDISGKALATFTLEGWKRGMTLSANPDAHLDLSLQELDPPTATNDIFTNRLHAMVVAVRAIALAIEADSWKNT